MLAMNMCSYLGDEHLFLIGKWRDQEPHLVIPVLISVHTDPMVTFGSSRSVKVTLGLSHIPRPEIMLF